ncbi:MAG TPA: DUF3570 domain-containing protein [Opitutaceae bacterium]|nr:DUF3570 domain-containing protein [Opitutaceae bacterium]
MPRFEVSARALVVASALQLILPRVVRAEGTVSYKFVSWREEEDRIRVDSQYGSVEDTLPAEVKVKLTGVLDSIAGATPTGELTPGDDGKLPTSEIDDYRKAWEANASRQFGAFNLALGFANSRESDYVSNGWSVNTQTELNQKNTTLLLGVAGTQDKVKVFFQRPWEKKRTTDFIAGVTQLLNPETSLNVDIGYGRSRGYLSDPYKLIEENVPVEDGLLLRTFGENRPREREKWTAFVGVNHAFTALNAAIDGSYRFYHDSFGINAHTVSIQWLQKLINDRLVLIPSIRFYQQTAAEFYRLSLDGTGFVPSGTPNPAGPFYSADFRLSHMRTTTLGIKAVVNVIPDRLTIDASYERYLMRGRDGVTPGEAYVDANNISVEASFHW